MAMQTLSLYDLIPDAPNFTLLELTRSEKAKNLGLDNTPDAEAKGRLIYIVQKIAQPARNALGPIRISSGYRSPLVNLAIGGSSVSAHQFGAALDMQATNACAASLALWIVENCPVWDQIIYERGLMSREWVHASLWPVGERLNRGEIRRHLPQDGNSYPHISKAQLSAWATARL